MNSAAPISRQRVHVFRTANRWAVASCSPVFGASMVEDGWVEVFDRGQRDPQRLGAAVRAGLAQTRTRETAVLPPGEQSPSAAALGYRSENAMVRDGAGMVTVSVKNGRGRIVALFNEGAGRGWSGGDAVPPVIFDPAISDGELGDLVLVAMAAVHPSPDPTPSPDLPPPPGTALPPEDQAGTPQQRDPGAHADPTASLRALADLPLRSAAIECRTSGWVVQHLSPRGAREVPDGAVLLLPAQCADDELGTAVLRALLGPIPPPPGAASQATPAVTDGTPSLRLVAENTSGTVLIVGPSRGAAGGAAQEAPVAEVLSEDSVAVLGAAVRALAQAVTSPAG